MTSINSYSVDVNLPTKKDLKKRLKNMENKIAFCGLDCEECEARKATINNDDELRKKSSKTLV